ncbi:MAG: hypothetical protein P4L87_17900 [Formivibrio sp.]|nr:hypothetical protein [Formivibrio sp.]
MIRRKLKRDLRKELLLLQSEQYRRGLAQDLRLFAPLWQGPKPATEGEHGSSVWLNRIPLLAAVLLPKRWRKLLALGLAIGKVALVFSKQPH